MNGPLHRSICASGLLAILATTPFSSVNEAVAAEPPGRLLAGCKPNRPPDYFYPTYLREKGAGGRVLLVVERTSKGWLEVVEVTKSEPSEAFIGPARSILKSLRCSTVSAPFREQISISFSLDPAPEYPHFEGVQAQLSVRSSIERVR